MANGKSLKNTPFIKILKEFLKFYGIWGFLFFITKNQGKSLPQHFRRKGAVASTITPWASENLRKAWSICSGNPMVCVPERKRCWGMRSWVGREEGGCLGQSCENSDLWNSLFSKKTLHWSKAWKREIWRVPKWPLSPRAASFLTGPAVTRNLQEVFPALNSPVITFICSVWKFKVMRILNNYWKTLRKWPTTGRGYEELDTKASSVI